MEYLKFEDLIRPNVGNHENASLIKTLALKQISRGKFEIVDNLCKVMILLYGEKRIVVFSNTIDIHDFQDQIYLAHYATEPSLDFLLEKTAGVHEPLLTFLKKYQEQFYKLGTEFANEHWYKLYSKTEIKSKIRKFYQASWIDYEKQLENERIIYDELGVCGLWAMPYNMLFKCLNEECKERYGDNLFILKPVPECKYIYDGKEIIGDKYKVIKKFDLNSIKDVGELIEYFISLEGKKYNTRISELNAKNRDLENNNTKILNNQANLYIILSRTKYLRWLFLLIGFIFGIVLCKLI